MQGTSQPPGYTVDLFAEDNSPFSATHGATWPDARRFPLNLESAKVKDVILPDLRQAKSPLLISVYASVDHLIDFVATCPDACQPRMMIGHEPYPSRRETYELAGR